MISTNSIRRFYDPTFTVTPEYKSSLPDTQNHGASSIEGANVPIQQVGISNFRLPLRYRTKSGDILTLETSVDAYVNLDVDKKGINMSRLIRTFYEFKDEVFPQDVIDYILKAYVEELDSTESFVRLGFNYPMIQESLRSELEGYQYYEAAIEGQMDQQGRIRKFIHLTFEYSSACPCSFELAEHARETRGLAAIPHSQRSQANLTVELSDDFTIEDLIELCRDALSTETQVIVKREDEQAFAEMNGAYQKFVEDAARLLYEKLDDVSAVRDFVIRCVHMESLHSHDAVSRICKGIPGGMR